MYETDHETIKQIFNNKIIELTKKSNCCLKNGYKINKSNCFDYQFSDLWISETKNLSRFL